MVEVVTYFYEEITRGGKFSVSPFVEVIVEIGENITLSRKCRIENIMKQSAMESTSGQI